MALVDQAERDAASAIEDFAEEPAEPSAALVAAFAVPGFLGSSLAAAGAVSVGWIARSSGLASAPVVEQLRTIPAFSLFGKMLVVLGIGLLLQAWLQLGLHVRQHRIEHPAGLGRLVWWWSAPLAVAPVLFSRDVFSYVALSRLLPNGIDPYLYGTGTFSTYYTDGADSLWRTSPAPYGPLWMGLSNIVYGVTHAEANMALLAFRLLALAGIGLLVVFVPRLAVACGVDAAKAVWLGVLNPLVLMHFVSAAHNDALMVGLLVAGLTLALERRFLLGVLMVTLAGAVKAPALLALPFVALAWAGVGASWARRVRAWVVAAALALTTFGALNLLLGLNFGWVSALQTPAAVRTLLSPMTALGMLAGKLGEYLGLGYHVDGTVAVFRTVGEVLTVAVIGWLVLTSDRRSIARGLGLALLVVVVLGPVLQPWYLLWGFTILAAAGLSRGETRAAVLLTIGFVVYSLVNTGATVDSYGDLSDGLAALLSVGIVLATLVSSKRVRTLLLADRRSAAPQVIQL